jgi:hypothetical protein
LNDVRGNRGTDIYHRGHREGDGLRCRRFGHERAIHGLLSRELVKRYAADVKALAQQGYLLEANIILQDAAGKPIRAAKYEVSTDGASLTAHRPGNNLWPRTPGGALVVEVRYSQKWRNLTDAQKEAFKKTLSPDWAASATDLSFPSLRRSADRSYVSNGWGVTKSAFS